MCLTIANFDSTSFFYRRYSPYQATKDGRPMLTVFIDRERLLSCHWCKKSSCQNNNCIANCQSQNLYRKEDAFKGTLLVRGNPPKPEIPFSCLYKKFPTVVLTDIKKYWDISRKKGVIFLGTFKKDKFLRDKNNLSQDIVQAHIFLEQAEQKWHVVGIQVANIQKAGFSRVVYRDPINNPGHVEICQEKFSESELRLCAKKLLFSGIVVK